LESAEPAKSAKSAESAGGGDYESGRFMVQGLTERTVGPDKGGSGSHANRGKNRQLQVRRGKSAAQIFRQTWAGRWTRPTMQENSSRGHADETTLVQARQAVLESAAPTKSTKLAESAAGVGDES